MSAVRVVTDSTADLGSLADAEGIAVIPLSVTFGDETFEDGVTIDAQAFFQRLAANHERPTTSQPTPGAIEETYRRLLADGASGIVAIHISSRLSGTYSTAVSTVARLREEGVTAPIEVIDSKQGSLSMHFALQAAAQAARAGGDVAAVAAAARDALSRTTLYLVADDLDYLQKGGRIGQAQRVIGTLLSVKPIITLKDGAVVAVENPRTRRRAYERLAEFVRDLAPVEAVIIGQSSQDVGDQLNELVQKVYSQPIRRMWAGPTIGTHVGPGAVGVAILRAR